MNKVYLLYYEYRPGKGEPYRGKTVQCDDLKELIFQLRECENNEHKNTHITTIEGKSQE